MGRKGFTLTELMVSMTLFLMTIGSMLAVYVMGQVIGTEGAAHVDMQAQANIAMEKIARGTNGRGGLREARAATVPTASQIDFTDVDLNNKSFYQNGSDLMYDPDTGTGGDEQTLVSGLRTAPFGFQVTQISTDQYRIQLALERQVGQDLLTVEVETGVTIRN